MKCKRLKILPSWLGERSAEDTGRIPEERNKDIRRHLTMN